MATNSAGVEYEAVSEPYVETENSVDNRKDVSDRLLKIHNVTSVSYTHLTLPTNREV